MYLRLTQLAPSQALVAIVCAAGISALCLRLRLLTPSGATAAFSVGAVTFAGGGGRAAVVLLTFFCTSNIWGKWRRLRKAALETEKSGPRDAAQVLANGGLPALCVLFSSFWSGHAPTMLLLFATAVAEANADTWATEIGSATSQAPRLITTLRVAKAGQSGAVSASGTLPSAAGACLIGLVSLPLFARGFGRRDFCIVTICGFAGSLFDSLLGATVQAEPSHAQQPEPLPLRTPIYRVSRIGNDLVNFLANLAACLLAASLAKFMG